MVLLLNKSEGRREESKDQIRGAMVARQQKQAKGKNCGPVGQSHTKKVQGLCLGGSKKKGRPKSHRRTRKASGGLLEGGVRKSLGRRGRKSREKTRKALG